MVRFSLFAPAYALGLLVFGARYFTSFLSLRWAQLSWNEWTIGVLQSAFYVGIFISAVFGPQLTKRFGHRALFCTAVAGCLAGAFLHTYETVAPLLAAGRFFNGCGFGLAYLYAESAMLSQSKEEDQRRGMAGLMTIAYGMQALSQLCLLFGVHTWWVTLAIVLITGLMSLIPACLAPPIVMPDIPTKTTLDVTRLLPSFAICMMAGMLAATVFTFGPTDALHAGLWPSVAMLGVLTAGALLQQGIVRLSYYWGRIAALQAAALVLLVGGMLWWPCWGTALHSIGFCCVGGCAFTPYQLILTLMGEQCGKEHAAQVSALGIIGYGVGSIVGPIVTGWFLLYHAPLFPMVLALQGGVLFLFVGLLPRGVCANYQ